MYVPHAYFPFDESPWIPHFHDAEQRNRREQIHAAGSADREGSDMLARHLMGAGPGENPYATYRGPFGEGQPGLQVAPELPSGLYSEYFGDYTPPGGAPGMGPFSDPSKRGPAGSAGPVVTGPAYKARNAGGR